MDIQKGSKVSGIDIYGKEVEGEIISILNTFELVTIKHGEDRNDKTTMSFGNIQGIIRSGN